VCEKPPFWRWMIRVSVIALKELPRFLVGAVKAVPGMVREIRMPRITAAIRDPFYEFFIGIMALFVFPMSSIITPDLTLNTRIVLALVSLPSFVLVMHSIYRTWWDC